MAVKQYFWADAEGAHVTTKPHEDGAAITGKNLLATSSGLELRDGDTKLAAFYRNETSLNGEAFLIGADTQVNDDGSTIYNGSMDVVCQESGTNKYGRFDLRIRWKTDGKLDVIDASQLLTARACASYTAGSSTNTYSLVTMLGSYPSIYSSKWTVQTNTIVAGETINIGNYGDTSAVNIKADYGDGSGVKVNGTDIMLLAYPVGSIYMSVNSTSPAELFGGTWEEIAGGRVLMGQNSTYAAGSTGGATTHTHTGPAHTHAYGFAYVCHYGAMLAYNTDGSYRILNNGTWENTPTRSSSASVGNNTPVMAATGRTTAYASRVAARANTSSSGTDKTGSASSLMPYLSVYMWKRTA